jgi:hypothetical protein
VSTVTDKRLALGRAAVLSVTEAASLLPLREADAIRWLRERRLVRTFPGTTREVVRWGDVYEAIAAGDEPQVSRPAAKDDTLPRGGLVRRS